MTHGFLSFDEILKTITVAEMIAPVPDGVSFSEMVYLNRKTNNLAEKILSPAEQKKNLAAYARWMVEHVGWDGFGVHNQQMFKRAIEQIWSHIRHDKRADDFFQSVLRQAGSYILDAHCIIATGQKRMGGRLKPRPQEGVGSNIMQTPYRPDGYRFLSAEYCVLDERGSEKQLLALNRRNYKDIQLPKQARPVWEIGSIQQGQEKILVVSCASLSLSADYQRWKRFIKCFDTIYGRNGQKWDRLILDFRGNQGGEDKPIDHIARRTYGNDINTYKRCEIRDTFLSDYALHKHGIFTRHLDKSVPVLKRTCFSGRSVTLFDETKAYYTFNPQQGYRGKITILTDRQIGSAAESGYTSFYHHPNVCYIGENTRGMQQFQQGNVHLPCGFLLRVGVTKLTYWDKQGENIECIGHQPDINCAGQDAFDVALQTSATLPYHILNEETPIQQKHALNGYSPYYPQRPDIRRGFSTKTVVEALSQIEKRNRLATCTHRTKS